MEQAYKPHYTGLYACFVCKRHIDTLFLNFWLQPRYFDSRTDGDFSGIQHLCHSGYQADKAQAAVDKGFGLAETF
ncbi:MAG: hypothetical protein LBV41_07390 [Cytophagaceae bacterium]|nr:hypothetical protein [Cytophagaceae bacterium]